MTFSTKHPLLDRLIEGTKAYTRGLVSNFKRRDHLRITQADMDEATRQTNDLFHPPHVPKDINGQPLPEDLADIYNPLIFDSHGKRVTGRLLLADSIGGSSLASPSPAWPILKSKFDTMRLALVPCFAVAAFTTPGLGVAAIGSFALYKMGTGEGKTLTEAIKELRSGGFVNAVQTLAAIGFGTLLPLAIIMFTADTPVWFKLATWTWIPMLSAILAPMARDDGGSREEALFQQDFHFRRIGVATSSYITEIKKAFEARWSQANRALKDKSPLMDLNLTAEGIFAQYGYMFAPDAGKKMVLTLNDLMPGAFIFGEPGTGKTAGVLRPVMDAWVLASIGGAVVFDNKGDLQKEHIEAILNYRFISPEDFVTSSGRVIPASAFNPIEGMDAETMADLLVQAMAGEQSKDDEWSKGARDLCVNLGIILEFACKRWPKNYKWHLHNIFKIITNENFMWEIINFLKNAKAGGGNEFIRTNPHLQLALDWVIGYYAGLADKTKSSLLMNIRGWANTLESNRSMSKWMKTDHGIMIEDSLRGDLMGIYCPKDVYGEAGTVIEKLCRWRLYRAIKARGSKWRDLPAEMRSAYSMELLAKEAALIKAGVPADDYDRQLLDIEIGKQSVEDLNRAEGLENSPRKHTFVLMLWDEMALGVGNGKQESDIMPVARSLGLATVAAAQSINQFFERMGTDRTRALLVNFPHLIVYRSDKETMSYTQEAMGYVGRIHAAGPNDVPVGIGYLDSLNSIAQSHNPGIAALYDQELLENTSVSTSISDRDGMDIAGRIAGMMNPSMAKKTSTSLSYKHVAPELAGMRFVNGGKVTITNKPLVDMEEIGRLLETPFHCFVQIQRGGVKRRDICVTTPIFANDIFAANDSQKKAA